MDTRTGAVRVLRLLGAHDSGRVMSLLTYRNQVFGGMTMGTGLAMTENRVLDASTGRMVNANWHDYKLPTALDVPPKPVCLPIERPRDQRLTRRSECLRPPCAEDTVSVDLREIGETVP